jgi:hypothetical protein
MVTPSPESDGTRVGAHAGRGGLSVQKCVVGRVQNREEEVADEGDGDGQHGETVPVSNALPVADGHV